VHSKFMPDKKGFTLIEMLITIVIIGILAATGYPVYTAFLNSGQVASAKALILSISAAEKMRRQQLGTFVAGTPAGWVSIAVGNGIYDIDGLEVDTGDAPNFEFEISNAGADVFMVTAQGRAGGMEATDTLIYSYNAVANPRFTWAGSLAEYARD